MPDTADTIPDLAALIREAFARQASDVLLTARAPAMVRIDGEWRAATRAPLSHEQRRAAVFALLDERARAGVERDREYDFALSIDDRIRVRANTYWQKGELSAVFRLIPSGTPKLDALGVPAAVKEFALRTRGLVLVTGAAGTGKTTTIAGMIGLINESRNCHIVTIEDPIEYVHANKKAIIDQREVGRDTDSFAAALRCVLRQAPDVIVVGEMRDLETMSAAITAAETGHLVIATLHTNDAIQAIDRIVDIFPAEEDRQVRSQLAFTLAGVVAQQLVPRRDGAGRVLASEVLMVTPAVAHHIRDGKNHMTRSLMETGRSTGMRLMDDSLKELYDAARISYDVLAAHVSHPDVLRSVQRRWQDEEGKSASLPMIDPFANAPF
ncbi:PilT/PilU family type 4a pilus ATPase [bacterium]|nr:PilT/PilU family type 4a pilus ATPase [bacterium]